MKNLNIYFSSHNQNQNTNMMIKQALEDDTFVTYARHALTQETISISFSEYTPSINGQYFSKFIYNLLDYSPYIKYITIITDGQSNNFYQNFIAPLYCYCTSHKRKIILIIQFRLDGPKDLHDKYHGDGSTDQCLKTITDICMKFIFKNKYLRLRLTTHSILQGQDLENYSVDKWAGFMQNLYFNYLHYFNREEDNKLGATKVAIKFPDHYTASQGRSFAKWKYYNLINLTLSQSCLLNSNSKTIDYLGNLYDCPLFTNKEINLEQLRIQFELTMNELVSKGEAIEQDREKLFNTISSIYCWNTNEQLENYIRLLGNGYLL